MRGFLISILIVSMGIKMSFGQTYYPMVQENSSWVVKWWYYDPYLTSFEIKGADTYTIFDSTIYDSVAYKYLFDEDSSLNNLDYSRAHLIREDSNKQVFIRFAQDSTSYSREFRIYDFGLEIGDTTSVYKGHALGDSIHYTIAYTMVLTKIDTVLFAGQERRRYHVDDTSLFSGFRDYWIEGVGSLEYGFLSNVATIEPSLSGVYNEKTRCYWNDDIYWREDTSRSCIYIDVPEFTAQVTELVYYPNPVKNRLQFSGEHRIDSYQVFDLMGSIKNQGEFSEFDYSIDFSSLNSGMYYVKIFGANEELWELRILKID